MTLTWETSYAIALELRKTHPGLDIAEVSLQQLYAWTLELEDFEDDPALCNDDILAAIYQEWLEESLNDGRSGT
jgi:FeS assembly protein IscX